MTKVIHGNVRGNTIELAEDPCLADGWDVEVFVRIVPATLSRILGQGTVGALTYDPHWDPIMDDTCRERKNNMRREFLAFTPSSTRTSAAHR